MPNYADYAPVYAKLKKLEKLTEKAVADSTRTSRTETFNVAANVRNELRTLDSLLNSKRFVNARSDEPSSINLQAKKEVIAGIEEARKACKKVTPSSQVETTNKTKEILKLFNDLVTDLENNYKIPFQPHLSVEAPKYIPESPIEAREKYLISKETIKSIKKEFNEIVRIGKKLPEKNKNWISTKKYISKYNEMNKDDYTLNKVGCCQKTNSLKAAADKIKQKKIDIYITTS